MYTYIYIYIYLEREREKDIHRIRSWAAAAVRETGNPLARVAPCSILRAKKRGGRGGGVLRGEGTGRALSSRVMFCTWYPEGTKRATSVNVQLPCLQKDLRTGSISRDIVNFPSELCRRRSGNVHGSRTSGAAWGMTVHVSASAFRDAPPESRIWPWAGD